MALVIFSRQVMRTVSLRDTIRIVEDEEGEQGKYSEFRDVEDSTTIFSPYWPILHGAWL
jgi:hypothetical protein